MPYHLAVNGTCWWDSPPTSQCVFDAYSISHAAVGLLGFLAALYAFAEPARVARGAWRTRRLVVIGCAVLAVHVVEDTGENLMKLPIFGRDHDSLQNAIGDQIAAGTGVCVAGALLWTAWAATRSWDDAQLARAWRVWPGVWCLLAALWCGGILALGWFTSEAARVEVGTCVLFGLAWAAGEAHHAYDDRYLVGRATRRGRAWYGGFRAL